MNATIGIIAGLALAGATGAAIYFATRQPQQVPPQYLPPQYQPGPLATQAPTPGGSSWQSDAQFVAGTVNQAINTGLNVFDHLWDAFGQG